MQETYINTIAIIGGGKMGKSIFSHLLKYNFSIVWINIDNPACEEKKFQKKITRLLNNNLISEIQYKEYIENIRISTHLADAFHCDLIIESITEDFKAKENLFKELYMGAAKHSIFTTNSSSIIPSKYKINSDFSERCVGMHFFFPVESNSLLELIITEQTNKTVIDIIKSFSQKINKKYFIQKGYNAFSINRFFLDIQAHFFIYCQKHQISFNLADAVVINKLFPTGIFKTMDMVGMEILETAMSNYIELGSNTPEIIELLAYIKKQKQFNSTESLSERGFLNKTKEDALINIDFEQQIIKQVNNMFLTFVQDYCNKGIFTKDELSEIIKEYTFSDYAPIE